MKRTVIILSLIFALAIAVSVSIPTLAATSDTGTTLVSGTVKSAIDIYFNTSTVSLADIIPGGSPATGSGTVTVKCNKAGWSLQAEDLRSAPPSKGHMDNGSTALYNPLYVNSGSLVGAVSLVSSGGKTPAAGTDTTTSFSQTPDWIDAPDNYSILVTFTATVAP